MALSKDATCIYKYRVFDRVRELIWADIERRIIGKGETKYIIPGKIIQEIQMEYMQTPLFHNGWFSDSFQNEFIEFLKKEFPDCSIEYIETKGYESKVVERLFIIYWSKS